MRLIERTARWVDPKTFKLMPLWYPEYGRRAYFYKANWSEPQMNKNRQTGHTEHKREGNLYANKALTHALGLRHQLIGPPATERAAAWPRAWLASPRSAAVTLPELAAAAG
jgi:hypothetical protein